MTVGSMFTGIGGLDRGFEAEGFEVIWMCERDPFCRAALAKHWPGVPVYDDAKMSVAQWRQVPRPDVIIGGFPCQDVRLARPPRRAPARLGAAPRPHVRSCSIRAGC